MLEKQCWESIWMPPRLLDWFGLMAELELRRWGRINPISSNANRTKTIYWARSATLVTNWISPESALETGSIWRLVNNQSGRWPLVTDQASLDIHLIFNGHIPADKLIAFFFFTQNWPTIWCDLKEFQIDSNSSTSSQWLPKRVDTRGYPLKSIQTKQPKAATRSRP